MDITKAIRNTGGRTRIVHPLADKEIIDEKSKFFDPAFFVEVAEETSRETARRWDNFKWDPTNKKDAHYSEKMMKVSSAEVTEIVKSWGNLFDGEVEIPCTDDNRHILIEVSVPTLDEDQKFKTLWRLTQIAIDKQRSAEAGN